MKKILPFFAIVFVAMQIPVVYAVDEVTTTGYRNTDNSHMVSANTYSAYLSEHASRAASTAAAYQTSGSGGGAQAAPKSPPQKPSWCADSMKFRFRDRSECIRGVHEAAGLKVEFYCPKIPDENGRSGCVSSIPFNISTGEKKCESDFLTTEANCS